MDELQKLYDLLVREGKFTKSFDEFKSKWSQQDGYKDNVFDVVSRDGFYTKDKNSFLQKYSGGGLIPQPEEQPVAQPIQPITQPTQGPIDLKKKEQGPLGVAALPSAPSFLDSQKQLPSFETTPLAGVKPAPKVKQPLDFIEPSLNTITPELINKNEEFVVPKMNYQFGDLGFKFEESGATGDWMTATAPNGKTIEVSLDPLFNSKAESESQRLKQFIKENAAQVKGLSAIERSYASENKKFETQKEVDESIKKVNNDATSLNQEMSSFLKQKKDLDTQFTELSKTPQNLKNTPDYISKSQLVLQKQKELEDQRQQLLAKQGSIESQSKSLDKAIGRYTDMKESQSAWYEIPLISLAKGVGSIANGLYGMSIDAINQFAPKEMLMGSDSWKSESLRAAKDLGIGEPSIGQSEDKWLNSLSETEKNNIDNKVRDNLKKRDKYMTVGGESQDPVYIKSKYIELAEKEGIKGPKSDSKEDYYKWLNTISDSKKTEFDKKIAETATGGSSVANLIRNSLSNTLPVNTTEEAYGKIQQGFFGGAITGAMESAPSFLGGGPISRLVRLFAQSEDAAMKDMENNPKFKDIPENEKRLVSAPISIATAVLEEYGFRNIIESKGLLNGIVGRALGKSGASTTSRSFAEFVRNDVDNMIARGTLKLVGGALAEAETGTLQQANQLAVEKIYNEVKGKEMYKLPEDAGGVIADILKSGAQEAIGGFVLGMPSAVSAAYTKKGFLGMNDATFKVFQAAANDENIQKAFVTKLKNQVNQGEMTIDQAKQTLNDYRNSVGLFKSMPDNLDIEGQKNAMNLLKEKRDLESQVSGKDPALVKPQKDRINAINESLTKLSEDAIQKQAANESLLRSQQSEMGLQQMGEGNAQPQVITTGTQGQITPENGTQEVVSSKTQVNVAPYFNTKIENVDQANELRQNENYKAYKEKLTTLATQLGIPNASVDDVIGGYKNDAGEDFVEISNVVTLDGATLDQAEKFAALAATIAPEVQEASIAAQYTTEGSDAHNANEYQIHVSDVNGAMKALKEAGISNFSVNENTGDISFIDVLDFADEQLQEKIGKFVELLDQNNINYEQSEYRPVESRYVDKGKRQEILGRIKSEGSQVGQGGEGLYQEIDQAIARDAQFRGITPEQYLGTQTATQNETKGEFETKATKLAEDIANFQIPSWFSATLPEGTQKAGLSAEEFKNLVAKSVIEVGKLMDKGVEFAAAVKEAVKDLVNLLGEDKRSKIEETVRDYFNKGEGVSENELPGYNALNDKVDAMIETQTKKKVDPLKIEKNVMALLQKSDAYKNATDVQKEKLVREARKKLGLTEKSAPSVARLKTENEPNVEGQSLFQKFFGAVKKDAKVTMTEKNLLKKQIKDLARGAKDAKSAWMKVSNEISKGIKQLITRGKISDVQAKNILRKFSNVNMFSEKSINSFIDYMTKVFGNAEYASKLNEAISLKKDISKFAKNKDKNANLRDMAQQFGKIDPSMVDDIDAYNEMAAKIREAIKGSTIRGEKVTFADTVNIENASDYIAKTMEAQDEKIREQKAEEIQELMGIDASELSYDDMMELLDSKEPITKYNESIIRDTIQKMFDIYSGIINETINTGKDQFNDEDVEFTKNQKSLVKRFMDMDLSLLKPKEALQAVDALANFLQNHSTAKMETVISEYTGNLNAKKLVDKGIVAQPLKKYWSEKFGRFLGEQTTNLNILFEKMFKGFNRGGEVEDLSGVTKLKNNKSIAEREANNIVEKYVNQFYKKTANGEAYNNEYNSVERGLAAFMMRNVIGTAKEMQKEFDRRKGLIEESIKVLSQGNEQEQKKSELYQKVYDKLLKDSESIQDVKDKTDETNLEGIEFWNKEWADKYEQLSDVSENVYNKVLDKDLNYTPDKFVRLSAETGPVELSNDESAFHNNNGTIYKKETGVLMTAVKPETLPTNPKSGDTNMYIDLSFDKNNSNAMYDALIDMGTAAPVRQIESFLNSSYFKKLVPKAEDAKILKDRIQLYVGNIRNKNPYSNDELSATVRSLNKIAQIGVGQALGGVLQPIKQVIPVAMNTVINAGGLDMGAMFNAAKNDFINKSGYAIANRGIESQAQVESLNKLIDEASKSKGEALLKNIEKLNKWWLEKFLVKPDVFIARASWITYYEQSLKKQGIDTKGIDYTTHEVNQEAADYAQRMVDRQQNVSDNDLAGKMFSNKESSNQLFVKILMPFASFRMNQSARLGADLAVLADKTATTEDKKIALTSVSGFAVEMATFKMIAAGSAILLGSAAKWALGKDEDDEEYKKRVNNVIKGQVTSTLTDVMSPLPILDKAYQAGGNYLTETLLGIPKESVFSIYGVPKQDYIQGLGLFGIAADRAAQLYDISKLSATGEYTDNFGKVKHISESDRDALSNLIGPAILSNVGLAPVEVNSIVRNAIKDVKKGGGKSPEEVSAKVERTAQKEEETSQKVEALDKLREGAKSQEELDAIDKKISVLEATPEEKKVIQADNKAERELKQDLLTDPETGKKYDNETELKRYNPKLYNENFGRQSEWYQDHKGEKEVEKKLNKEVRKMEDVQEGYTAPIKTKKRNSDGTIKSSSFSRVRKDVNGKVISSFKRTTN